MSIEAVSWALGQPVEHSSAKFVLVVLANHADADGVCWPSIQSIADSTSQDRKTVIANIKRLLEMGWIQDTGIRKGGTGQVPVYRLNSAKNGTVKQSQKREPLKEETVPFFPINSTVFPYKQYRFSAETVPKTGHGTVSEPSTEPSRKEKTTRSKSASVDWVTDLQARGVDRVVAESWLQVRKSKNAAVTVVAVDGIQREAQKSGLPLDDVLRMCCERGWAGFKASWLNEQPRGSPALTGRDASRAAAAKAIFGDMNHEPRIIDVTPTSAGALGCKDFP